MRTDLHTIATEDTAIQCKRIATEIALCHHQRTSRTDLHTSTTGNTVCAMQADVERRGDDRIKAFAKHAITVWTDHIMTDPHTLRTVDTLVRITQDETM